ncbi:MAG TPA: zinc-ribbon domain containing protein [candidate division Zixibacteria bacterium]|nr:zinc-ribbon domain containing protein [candidate division Zixibacteria bacterium]
MAERYKILICSVCGEEFVFTGRGQDYFASIGYAYDPKRCKACHADYKRRQRAAETATEKPAVLQDRNGL